MNDDAGGAPASGPSRAGGPSRVGAAVRRATGWLVPAGRRDWVEAVWAEAPEVPRGLRRLAWRAGGARLMAREALMLRRIGGALLFAVVAAVVARAAWPDSPASVATPTDQVHVIVLAVLAGLPLLARPLLGPVGDSWAARLLRFGTCAAFLALIPASVTVEQFQTTPPRGAADLRVYLLIAGQTGSAPWGAEALILAVMALYMAAIVWMTSRRARIAPATLAVGTGAGILLGLVMYLVAPLGLSSAASNPWLPGSDIDPLVVLAWLLLPVGPMTAAVIAHRRYAASCSSPPPLRSRVRQLGAAGLLTGLVGALLVTVAGTGTTAVMVKAAWLRDWLYHGHHLLYGIQNLSSELRTLPAIAYGHELTGSVDQGVFWAICIFFPLVALLMTAGVVGDAANAAAGRADPRLGGGGGPEGPGPTPDPPPGGEPAVTDDEAGLAAGVLVRG
jgi:hypothetical protein